MLSTWSSSCHQQTSSISMPFLFQSGLAATETTGASAAAGWKSLRISSSSDQKSVRCQRPAGYTRETHRDGQRNAGLRRRGLSAFSPSNPSLDSYLPTYLPTYILASLSSSLTLSLPVCQSAYLHIFLFSHFPAYCIPLTLAPSQCPLCLLPISPSRSFKRCFRERHPSTHVTTKSSMASALRISSTCFLGVPRAAGCVTPTGSCALTSSSKSVLSSR